VTCEQDHPGLQLALTLGDRTLDIMRNEVDLAIRYGPLLDSSGFKARMLAVVRPMVTASPAYLARHPEPKTPEDLLQHNCITVDRGGRPYLVWRFVRDGKWTEVSVRGNRIADDASLARVWAASGGRYYAEGADRAAR
jgi:DNA-binding transcriptional LysR family regulator